MQSKAKQQKKPKKRSFLRILAKLFGKLTKTAVRAFLLLLKILPFASMCVERLEKKESSS
ncbi:MAG: hypothetical protein J5532_05555 [Lachnospiraceae bacterium]|nr:hypothetical protein [Lachnospiraceae bacterium]